MFLTQAVGISGLSETLSIARKQEMKLGEPKQQTEKHFRWHAAKPKTVFLINS
jgi:hypothetical protein